MGEGSVRLLLYEMQVRSLRESRGDVEEAGPSIAVQMVGLNAVPVAGDEFTVCSSEQEVRSLCCIPSLHFRGCED